MSQQEFESSPEEREVIQPKYPYSWSGQEIQKALPRDEPPITYGTYADSPEDQAGQPQVPWWARPQPNQTGPLIFAFIIIIVILIGLVLGGLSIAGIVFGSLLHLAGMLIGALVVLLICIISLIALVLSLIRRAFSRAFSSRQAPNRRAPGS
jgi:predicted lipid-binding transport protein (Tim44 family)